MSEVIVLNDNGAWSWFEDERAVVDPVRGTLLVSSVADASGTGGMTRDGNVEVVTRDLATGDTRRTVLHAHLQDDDHSSAALYVRPDGGHVAMYATHAADTLTRWRVSDGPGIDAPWKPERTLDHAASATYSNVYSVGRGEQLYAFVRAGRDPHFLVSNDQGMSWHAGGSLVDGSGAPYVRYAADHLGRIHLITTEQHPRTAPTSIYHGIIDDGRLRTTDGTVVDPDLFDDAAARPERLTTVFEARDGVRAWTIDVQVAEDGQPYAAFSVHSSRHEYWYARFEGGVWHTGFLAHAGSALYGREAYYTGLVALDPGDPGRVVVSADVHPATGVPLISAADGQQHHELFEGITPDEGATWRWTAITANSTVDNLRPIIPVWDGDQRALVWLRGVYTKYTDYDLDVVAIITDRRNVTAAATEAASAASGDGAGRPAGPRGAG